MLPNATELEYFLQVAKTQNISKTAYRLGVSQPTITQAIKKLEESVGARLFLRSRRGVRLTSAGHRVLSQITVLFEVWQSLRRAALEEETELRGRFRIGVHPSVARYTLPAFFSELSKKAPKIEVTLFHDLSRKVAEAVINHELDLGLVINPPSYPDLVLKRLGTDTVGIYEVKGKRHSDILFGHPELVQTQDILAKLKKSKFNYVQFVECNNLEVIQSLVEGGAGFGILPARVAHLERNSRMELADPKLPQFHDEIFAIYRRESMATKAGRAVVEIIGKIL